MQLVTNSMQKQIHLILSAIFCCIISTFAFPAFGQNPALNNSTSINYLTVYVEPIYFPLFLLASFVVIAGVTVITVLIIRKFKRGETEKHRVTFLDVIRDGDYFPSLPRFQFLVWTFVISFVYLSIYLIRLYSGKFDAPFIDNNLLILLGISIASPLLGNVISGYKYSKRVSGITSDDDNLDSKKYDFKTMLFENDKPALFRYQMFLWTFIGVFIFLGVFVESLYIYTLDYISCKKDQGDSPILPNSKSCKEINSLKMPTVDLMLVTLMGLSQSGYLGGKIVARSPSRIKHMYPGLQDKFIVLGFNFGDKSDITSGTILINNKVIAGHTDPSVKWFDTKIEFQLPAEYRDKPFHLGIIIDDVVFLEEDYNISKPVLIVDA